MDLFLTVVLSGVQNGLIYALIGLGFVLIFRVDGSINLALGESAVLAVLLGYTLHETVGLPIWVTLPCVAVAGGAVGGVTSTVFVRRMRSRNPLRVLVLSFGIALILQNIMRIFWSTDLYSLPTFPGVPETINVFSDRVVVPGQAVYILLLAVLVFALWAFILWRTPVGRDMRAVSSDAEVASAVGILSDRVVTGAWIASSLLVAVAGFFVSPVLFLSYAGGTLLAVKGLVAAIIGGINRPFGALLGGLLLGLAESATAGYYSVDWKDVTVFGLLILVLIVRPNGLLVAVKESR